MAGHIRKRGKHSWEIVLPLGFDPIKGKYQQRSISVKGTKKDAERRRVEILHQMDTGSFIEPSKVTMAEYFERWLKDFVWPNLSPRTSEGYEHIVRRHLIPKLGSIPLMKLKPEHIQRYYSEQISHGRLDGKGGLSLRTIRHHHMTLHDALQKAVKSGLLSRNVADAVDAPRFQAPEMHTLDEQGVLTILKAAKEAEPEYYPIFFLAIYTGMRRGELIGLQWGDLDLVLGYISISRSLHHLRDGSISIRQPKTVKGRRMIALPPPATLMLKQYREQQEAIHALVSKPLNDRDWVFSDENGSPLLPDSVTHAWIRLARRTGFRNIRLHDLRHTHASLMLKQGVHPKVVQERLGHASISMTLDTYSHVTPGIQEQAANSYLEGLPLNEEIQHENQMVVK